MDVRLIAPSREWLPHFVTALRSGWSPSSERDVIDDTLANIEADTDGFLAQLNGRAEGVVRLADGSEVPRLPGRVFWIDAEGFAGTINYRFLPGTEALPPHVSGHIGYTVVPWKWRRGIATRALALLLPHLAEAGLSRALITCDEENVASRKVIEANGGAFAGFVPHATHDGVRKATFWIACRVGRTA